MNKVQKFAGNRRSREQVPLDSNVHVGMFRGSSRSPGSIRSKNQVQEFAGIRRFREQVPLGSNDNAGCSGEVQGPDVPRIMFRSLQESEGSGTRFQVVPMSIQDVQGMSRIPMFQE
jgi:hypothetical protein